MVLEGVPVGGREKACLSFKVRQPTNESKVFLVVSVLSARTAVLLYILMILFQFLHFFVMMCVALMLGVEFREVARHTWSESRRRMTHFRAACTVLTHDGPNTLVQTLNLVIFREAPS